MHATRLKLFKKQVNGLEKEIDVGNAEQAVFFQDASHFTDCCFRLRKVMECFGVDDNIKEIAREREIIYRGNFQAD